MVQRLESVLSRSTTTDALRRDHFPLSDRFALFDQDEATWQSPPPEALNPNNTPSTSKPTSTECIKRITRIKVEEHSAILHQVSITLVLPPDPILTGETSSSESVTTALTPILRRKHYEFDAIMAEFPPYPPFKVTGRLIYGGTGKHVQGQSLSHMIPFADTTSAKKIAYMERGDGITFVQKAIIAQKNGCCAVICGNNVPVWPYIMKDATLEATKAGLNIPIVMVKRSDGERMHQLLQFHQGENKRNDSGSIRVDILAERVSSDAEDCVVCREPYSVGDIVMRLPFCSHSFHEDCAMSWLTRHNTCPFCRRELPTDDPDYEAERRRQQRTHAGSGPHSSIESPWDSLFG
jgi:hypothetical protein